DLLIAAAEVERGDGHPVLEALQVPLPIEGLERVRGVVLERTEEGGEAELVAVGPLEERLDEGRVVLLEDLRLVVVVLDQVRELLIEVVEEHSLGDLEQVEVLASGIANYVDLFHATCAVERQKHVH